MEIYDGSFPFDPICFYFKQSHDKTDAIKSSAFDGD